MHWRNVLERIECGETSIDDARRIRDEVLYFLDILIHRGEELEYEDDDFRMLYRELQHLEAEDHD